MKKRNVGEKIGIILMVVQVVMLAWGLTTGVYGLSEYLPITSWLELVLILAYIFGCLIIGIIGAIIYFIARSVGRSSVTGLGLEKEKSRKVS